MPQELTDNLSLVRVKNLQSNAPVEEYTQKTTLVAICWAYFSDDVPGGG